MTRKTERGSSEIETRCSAACTRSGVAALLIAVFAVSLVGLLKQEKINQAVSKYYSLRLQLKTAIETLDQDPCWGG
jgi:hypothetical protein